MQTLNHWLKQQADRNFRWLSIADLLFTNKRRGYLYFRLRYFNWLVIIRLFFHLMLIGLLQRSLAPTHFYQLSGVWVFSLMLSSAWWGGLEVLRTRIRDFYSTKDIAAINREISHWFILGLGLASLMLLAALSQLLTGIKQWQHDQAAFSYFFNSSLLLMLAGRLIFEPLHSGIYAVSRILRPIHSLLLGETAGFLCIVLAWSWLGKAVLIIAFLLAGIINLSLRYYYCRRMYAFFQLALSLTQIKLRQFLKQLAWLDFGLAALAMLAMNFESLLLLLMISINSEQILFQQLFMLLFLALPLLNASSEWAQLFYFDWKKLRRFNFSQLQQRYDQSILLLAPFIGLLLSLVVSGLAYILLPQTSWLVYGVVLVLLLTRSMIAYLQIRAFACFRYLDILLSSGLLLTLLALVYGLHLSGLAAIVLLLTGLIGITAYLLQARFRAIDRVSQFKQQLNYYDWLAQLWQVEGELQVAKLSIAANTSYYKQLHIVSWLINNYLQATDRICVIGKQIIFYRLNTPTNKLFDPAALAINSAGLINVGQCSDVFTKKTQQLPCGLLAYLAVPIGPTSQNQFIKALAYADFLQQFPDGIYFTPACHLGPKASEPPRLVIHSLLYQADLFLKGQPNEQFPYEIAIAYTENTIQAIYAVPRAGYPRSLLRTWRSAVDSSNIYAILQAKVAE